MQNKQKCKKSYTEVKEPAQEAKAAIKKLSILNECNKFEK